MSEHEIDLRVPVRAAMLEVPQWVLARLLNLPDDVECAGVYWEAMRAAWVIHFRGPSLPLVEDGRWPASARLLAHVSHERNAQHETVSFRVILPPGETPGETPDEDAR